MSVIARKNEGTELVEKMEELPVFRSDHKCKQKQTWCDGLVREDF